MKRQAAHRRSPVRYRRAPARRRRRAAAWLTATAALGVAVASVALLSRTRLEPGAATARTPRATSAERTAAASRNGPDRQTAPGPSLALRAGGTTAAKPTLSRRARRACPAAASACVDLPLHLTWLQSGGRVSYGPVRMEPGPPGSAHATPRGTFHVAWKAGAHYISTEFGDPMPWAVFFAPGGVAFHGGSLTKPSHGCVHLRIATARYYHDHLPIGAVVAVF